MRSKRFRAFLFILVLCLSFCLVSCGGGSDNPPAGGGTAQNLKVFVASEAGSGNLTSWTAYANSGSSATGLEAADAICQYLAQQAGLSGTFRAWLSDSNTDAYCHLHGLTGKKADNCGQASLPTPYGPWVRMDGFPFGENIDVITTSYQIYAPVLFDENGNTLGIGQGYFAETGPNGTRLDPANPDYNACLDWTSSSNLYWATLGDPTHTAHGWTFSASIDCASPRRLLCMQVGTGPSLPSHTTSGKIAFVTSVYGNGDLSGWTDAGGATGIAAGDNICKARAAAAGLSNSDKFKAWLSDSTTKAIDRLSSNGPWVRIDGVKIADDKADLTDGTIFSSINQTENGDYVGNTWVWTGTTQSGDISTGHCNNWTNGTNAYAGNGGVAYATSSVWTNYFSGDCNTVGYRLYCFEDQ